MSMTVLLLDFEVDEEGLELAGLTLLLLDSGAVAFWTLLGGFLWHGNSISKTDSMGRNRNYGLLNLASGRDDLDFIVVRLI